MPGFYSATVLDPCKICPADSYCPGNTSVVACPPNSVSAIGQAARSSCTGLPGYVYNQGACLPCPTNASYYCPGGLAQPVLCPLNSLAQPLASTLAHCICLAGYVVYPNLCVACSAGTYSPLTNASACAACPQARSPSALLCVLLSALPPAFPCALLPDLPQAMRTALPSALLWLFFGPCFGCCSRPA